MWLDAYDAHVSDETLTTPEVAEVLGVSEGRVRTLVVEGKLKPVRPQERPLRFRSTAVVELEWLRRPERNRVRLRHARDSWDASS